MQPQKLQPQLWRGPTLRVTSQSSSDDVVGEERKYRKTGIGIERGQSRESRRMVGLERHSNYVPRGDEAGEVALGVDQPQA